MATSTINMILNSDGEIILFNPSAEKMTGYTAQEVQNTTPWSLFFNQQNAVNAEHLFSSISKKNTSLEKEMALSSRSGEERLVLWEIHGANLRDGGAEFIVVTGRDITAERFYKQKAEAYKELGNHNLKQILPLKRSNRQLDRLSRTDHLTNLYNRRHFDDALQRILQHPNRGDKTVSLLLCDVDHFKAYNDLYGHIAGDLALQQIAAILSECSQRSEDIVARYGGEEFALILPGADCNGALSVATSIMDELARIKIIHEGSPDVPHLTMSIGAVTTDVALLSNSNELIRQADQQLYEAKKHGRNIIMSLNHATHYGVFT